MELPQNDEILFRSTTVSAHHVRRLWEERDRRASGFFCSSEGKENSVLARTYKAPSVPHEQMVQCCLVWKLLWSSADNVHFLTSLESVMSSHSSECISSQASVI